MLLDATMGFISAVKAKLTVPANRMYELLTTQDGALVTRATIVEVGLVDTQEELDAQLLGDVYLPIIDTRDYTLHLYENDTWTSSASTPTDLVDQGYLTRDWLHVNPVTGGYFHIDTNITIRRL